MHSCWKCVCSFMLDYLMSLQQNCTKEEEEVKLHDGGVGKPVPHCVALGNVYRASNYRISLLVESACCVTRLVTVEKKLWLETTCEPRRTLTYMHLQDCWPGYFVRFKWWNWPSFLWAVWNEQKRNVSFVWKKKRFHCWQCCIDMNITCFYFT